MKHVYADRMRRRAAPLLACSTCPPAICGSSATARSCGIPAFPIVRWAPALVFGLSPRALHLLRAAGAARPSSRASCSGWTAAAAAAALRSRWRKRSRDVLERCGRARCAARLPAAARADRCRRETRVLTFVADPRTGYAGSSTFADGARSRLQRRGARTRYLRRTAITWTSWACATDAAARHRGRTLHRADVPLTLARRRPASTETPGSSARSRRPLRMAARTSRRSPDASHRHVDHHQHLAARSRLERFSCEFGTELATRLDAQAPNTAPPSAMKSTVISLSVDAFGREQHEQPAGRGADDRADQDAQSGAVNHVGLLEHVRLGQIRRQRVAPGEKVDVPASRCARAASRSAWRARWQCRVERSRGGAASAWDPPSAGLSRLHLHGACESFSRAPGTSPRLPR